MSLMPRVFDKGITPMNQAMQKAAVRKNTSSGFSLIELMIVVAIIGILATIAYPSYIQYTVRTNRSAAESFIMGVANKQEQYILDKREYATTLALLHMAVPDEVSKNYNISGDGFAANITVTTTPPTYTITAVPIPGGFQATHDTHCGSVSITHTGAKSADTGATDCW